MIRVERIAETEPIGVPWAGTNAAYFGARQDAEAVSRSWSRAMDIGSWLTEWQPPVKPNPGL
jgi:hypothetical protein